MDGNIASVLASIPQLKDRQVELSELPGGMTNRNYLVRSGSEKFVLRLCGDGTSLLGIDRQVENDCARAAAAADLSGEVIAFLPELGATLNRYVEGTALTGDDVRQPQIMTRVVKALKTYHGLSGSLGRFSPFDTVRNYHRLSLQHGVEFPQNIDAALSLLWRIEQSLPKDGLSCPCHNDLLAANLIDDGSAVRIIDWEFAGRGDLYFDLGNLAGNCDFETKHERALLYIYFGEAKDEQLERLKLLRLASDMREAMWGFLQTGISSLSVDYGQYARNYMEKFFTGARAAENTSGLLQKSRP